MLFDEDGERFSMRVNAACCAPSSRPGRFAPPRSVQMAYTRRSRTGTIMLSRCSVCAHRAQRSAAKAAAAYSPTRQGFSIAEQYRDACKRAEAALSAVSPMKREIGCVILASGLAKRFGSNKLLAGLTRKPLLCRAFAVTEDCTAWSLPARPRCRHCVKECGIPVLHHALPFRSDTVRLGLEYLLPRFPAMSGCVFLPGDRRC